MMAYSGPQLQEDTPYEWTVSVNATPACVVGGDRPPGAAIPATAARSDYRVGVSRAGTLSDDIIGLTSNVEERPRDFLLARSVMSLAPPAAGLQLQTAVAHVTGTTALARAPNSGDAFHSANMQGRILSGYRLRVEGAVVGIGPGRGDAGWFRASRVPNRTYAELALTQPVDALNVTDTLLALIRQGASEVCLGLEGFGGALLLRLSMTWCAAGSGCVQSYFGTSGDHWTVLNATGIYNPTGVVQNGTLEYITDGAATPGVLQPNVQTDWRAYPSGWDLSSYSVGAAWQAAAVQPHFLGRPAVQSKRAKPLQVTGGIKPVSITLDSSRTGEWLVDFGLEVQGGLEMVLEASAAGGSRRVEVRMSEELNTLGRPRVPMTTGNNYTTIWTFPAGGGAASHLLAACFRWVHVRVQGAPPTATPPFKLTAWSAQYPWNASPLNTEAVAEAVFGKLARPALVLPRNRTAPPPRALALRTSDAGLNSVTDLCLYTLQASSWDTATDSNTRERLPYEADAGIHVSGRLRVQLDTAWVEHSLENLLANPTWPTEWRQWTILMAHGLYMQTGISDLAHQYRALLANNTMARYLDPATGFVNFTSVNTSAGALGLPGFSPVLDWPPANRHGLQDSNASTIVNTYAAATAQQLAEVLAVPPTKPLAAAKPAPGGFYPSPQQLQADAVLIRRSVLEYSTNGSSGGLCDGPCVPAPPGFNVQYANHTSQQSTSFGVWLGLFDSAKRLEEAVRYSVEGDIVGSVYAAFGLLQAFYRLPALEIDPILEKASASYGAYPLRLMRRCEDVHFRSWCAMLAAGGDLFHWIKSGYTGMTWEDWNAQDKSNLSRSHSWATAPVFVTSRWLLGVEATEAGWGALRVAPQVGTLDHAAGTVQTPRGPIAVAIENGWTGESLAAPSGNFSVTVACPATARVQVCLPTPVADASDRSLHLAEAGRPGEVLTVVGDFWGPDLGFGVAASGDQAQAFVCTPTLQCPGHSSDGTTAVVVTRTSA